MNASTVARHYDRLTAEERFRLILAAGGRGDQAEQNRLRDAGPQITLSTSDHAPWARAFDELALTVFLEMVEEAAKHHDAFECWCDAEEAWSREHETAGGLVQDDRDGVATGDGGVEEDQQEPVGVGVAPADEEQERSIPTRTLHLYLAQGFALKTKIAGWKMFCERLGIPPFVLWQILPGWERLKRALELLEDNEFRPGPAFQPEGMLRWLSKIRPKGAPEPAMEDLISPERFAQDLDKVFRLRVEWWGG